jgi:hypothetical protein
MSKPLRSLYQAVSLHEGVLLHYFAFRAAKLKSLNRPADQSNNNYLPLI